MSEKRKPTIERTWENYTGDLARPLNILVYQRAARNGPFHAHSIQYSTVYARGATQVEAVTELLDLLLHHLYECQTSKSQPMHAAAQIYQTAFYTGSPARGVAKEVEALVPVRVAVRTARGAARSTGERLLDIRVTSMGEIVGS